MFNPTTKKIIFFCLCLLTLYLTWGTGYLLIKIALNYYPPLLQAGIKITLAGSCLLLYSYIKKETSPITWTEIKRAGFLGFWLVVVGTAFIPIGQATVPSGTTAMMFGASPILLLVGTWLLAKGTRPTNLQLFGLFLGFAMVIWINAHQGSAGGAKPFDLLMIFLGVIGWVYGSYLSYKPNFKTNLSIFRSTGLVLFEGGIVTLILGFAMGENLGMEAISFEGLSIMLLMTFASSVLGFTCYLWLLANARPSVAISYEYVVPVVAIYFGWQLGGEPLDKTIIFACLGLIVSIMMVVSRSKS